MSAAIVRRGSMPSSSSFLATAGNRCICVYEAPDGDAVRQAYRAAGAPFDAVWPANYYR